MQEKWSKERDALYYLYKTNIKKDSVTWAITGELKVREVLTQQRVDAILRRQGITPPPVRKRTHAKSVKKQSK